MNAARPPASARGARRWQLPSHLLQPRRRALRQARRHRLEQQQVVPLPRQATVDPRLGLRHSRHRLHKPIPALLHVLRQLQGAPARHGTGRQLQRRCLCRSEQLGLRDHPVNQANGQPVLGRDGLPAHHQVERLRGP